MSDRKSDPKSDPKADSTSEPHGAPSPGTPSPAGTPPSPPALGNFGRLLGALGFVLALSAVFTALFFEGLSAMFWAKIVLGVLAVAVYIAAEPSVLGRLAGARSTSLLATSAISAAVVLLILAVLNFVSFKNPKEVDLTREGIFTLSQQTVEVLARLPGEVQVLGFYSGLEPEEPEARAAFERYREASPKFAFSIVDPETRLDLVEKYAITSTGARIVLSLGDREARAKAPSEEELTNGLQKLIAEQQGKIHWLEGHGERKRDAGDQAESLEQAAKAIVAEGFELVSLRLTDVKAGAGAATALEVPAEVTTLIVADPRGPLLDVELGALERFLNRGGRMMMLLEPNTVTGLEGLLKQWKIEVRDDIVADVVGAMSSLGWAGVIAQPSAVEHPISRDLKSVAVLHSARSLAIAAGGEAGVDADELIGNQSSAWGETSGGPGEPELDDKDHPPPLVLGIAATKNAPDPEHPELGTGEGKAEGRLVVFGDADFASNRLWLQPGNPDLFLNSVNWVAAREDRVTIRPKLRGSNQLALSVEALGYVKFFAMDIVPVLLLAFGFGIVINRRSR